MPLFEAIINSLHAIQDSGRKDGRITISIEREKQDGLFSNSVPDIENFCIIDNGIGFDEKNYRSFYTLDSRLKLDKGGKGIGRLLWLKTFDHAEITSTYREDKTWWKRTFHFKPSSKGVEPKEHIPLPETKVTMETVVRLIGFKKDYREAVPKTAPTISRRIVEHCLDYFLLGNIPKITVMDTHQETPIDLNKIFKEDYQPKHGGRHFEIHGKKFEILDIFLKSSVEDKHYVYFCANNRAVDKTNLTHKIPHLEGSLTNEGNQTVFYAAYVSGPFLDERVDSERTGFEIDRRGQLNFKGDLTWEDIHDEVMKKIEEFIEPLTQSHRDRAYERIVDFVTDEEPKYRPLLTHRKDALRRLSGNLSKERLDLELHRTLNSWRHEIRKEMNHRLDQAQSNPSMFQTHAQEFRQLMGELQDVTKSDLAEYVIHRAAALDFFNKILGKNDDGTFEREEVIHELFFPLRQSSDQVDYDDHNLWLIDERLAYHQYLASDLPFSKHEGPIEVESKKRPDILIYNKAMAFTPGEQPYSSCVIIEFKRPERQNQSGDNSPITQVLDYVAQIREGRAKRDDGSTIDQVDAPIYCYIIASITNSLRKDLGNMDYYPTPDRAGYFYFNKHHRAYIEIISPHKLLSDAKKRNRAFMDKLQIRLK